MKLNDSYVREWVKENEKKNSSNFDGTTLEWRP